MFILNSIFPVFALIIAGRIFKNTGLINENFLTISDRLIYFIFFPAMLFWKIGGNSAGAEFSFNVVYASLITFKYHHVHSFSIGKGGRDRHFTELVSDRGQLRHHGMARH